MGIFSSKPAAIDHTPGSALGTTLWEGAKGVAFGAMAIGIAGAVGLGLTAAILGSASILSWALVGGVVGLGVSSLMPVTTLGMASIGGLFGWARGKSRVSREQSEFDRQVAENFQSRQQAMMLERHNGFIDGMTVGYMTDRQNANSKVEAEMQRREATAAAGHTQQQG